MRLSLGLLLIVCVAIASLLALRSTARPSFRAAQLDSATLLAVFPLVAWPILASPAPRP